MGISPNLLFEINFNNMKLKTILDKDFKILNSDYQFDYQIELTAKLDFGKALFDQNVLNEIVLWKVNRYAKFEKSLIDEINSIDSTIEQLDIQKTTRVLRMLLKTKGVQLPMASIILRFRNPKTYQIIDQRVFRIIYEGKEFKVSNYLNEKNIQNQIDLYLKYLIDLRAVCSKLDIRFEHSDRILFMADKRLNKNFKLRNY